MPQQPELESLRKRRIGAATAWLPALVVLVSILTAAGCASRRPPVLEPLRTASSRNPVVLVPGITGTKLYDTCNRRTVWGDSRSLFRPKDGGYSTVLPLTENGPDCIEATTPVLGFRVLLVRKVEAYGPLIDLFTANGFVHGDDPFAPGAAEDFFLFPYDWRRANLHAVRLLAAMLESLREARGEDILKVDLVCQSNAGRICRYLTRYGAASLEEAEAGAGAPPPGIVVDRVILVGTANGGAMRTLRELDRGRRYVPLIGRKFQPETFFTYPSLYESLPFSGGSRFLDSAGNELPVDLSDPEAWERYGWTIFGAAASARVDRYTDRHDDPRWFGDLQRRREFLAESLDRAARLHRLLREDIAPVRGTRYYSIQNRHKDTPARAVLENVEGEWKMRFCGDRYIKRRDALRRLACAPGDGHATRASQEALSPSEQAALAEPPFHLHGKHFEMILQEAAQRKILEYLLD